MDLLDVSFLDSERGIAVGEDGAILSPMMGELPGITGIRHQRHHHPGS